MNEMTESWLSFPRFADVMRRPLVEFHHSCGTAVTVADARVMDFVSCSTHDVNTIACTSSGHWLSFIESLDWGRIG